MLRFLQPANWFFILMAMAIFYYIAYNFNNSRMQSSGRGIPAAASLIRYIVR